MGKLPLAWQSSQASGWPQLPVKGGQPSDPLLVLFLHSHPLWSMNFLSGKSASSLACFGSACKKIRSFLVEGIKEMRAVNYRRPEVMPGLLNVIGRIGE